MDEKIPIEISLCVENFKFSFEGSKLANSIKKNQEFKKKLNEILKTNNFSYKIDLVPEPLQKEIIREWYARAHQTPKILVSAIDKNEYTDLSQQDRSISIGLIMALEDSTNKRLRKEYEDTLDAKIQKFLETQDEKNEETIKRAIEKTERALTEKYEPILNQYKARLEASNVIHPLVNVISLFRKKIMLEINRKEMLDFKDWQDLETSLFQQKKYYLIDMIVNELGLNVKDWYHLKQISAMINELKHPNPLKLDEVEAQINALEKTEYENFIPSFKNLVQLFKEKNWNE